MMAQFRSGHALALVAGLGLLTSACSEKTLPPSAVDDAFITQANTLADAHQADLQQALMGAIAEVGPVGAIGVCETSAPALAAALSEESGVEVGRIAKRHRNPGNGVPAELAALYDDLERQPMADGAPRFVSAVVADRQVVLRAIPMKDEPCALCHGKSIAPEVTAAIKAAYPQDTATGFAAGELRGAFLVSRPAS
jgi:hypothetical protein